MTNTLLQEPTAIVYESHAANGELTVEGQRELGRSHEAQRLAVARLEQALAEANGNLDEVSDLLIRTASVVLTDKHQAVQMLCSIADEFLNEDGESNPATLRKFSELKKQARESLAEARENALEEAAKIADTVEVGYDKLYDQAAYHCAGCAKGIAEGIRALKVVPAPASGDGK